MAYSLPTATGINDLVLTALVNLFTLRLQTEVDAEDVSRAVMVKAGPRQASPESVAILVHENHPDYPDRWQHQPIQFRGMRPSAAPTTNPQGLVGDTRLTTGMNLVGGGSQYSRAYTAEIEVFGRSFPADLTIEREDVRQVASVVEHRLVKALFDAGPNIGAGALISDDFGESVVGGPFLGPSWAESEESESLAVRKMVQFWYRTSQGWSTSAW